jgi:sugar O-acyltransferase (sialic acid O-acetyltransferase NeuD family)
MSSFSKPIFIFGAGEIAQIARYYFEHLDNRKVVAYTTDREFITEAVVDGVPVVPSDELIERFPPSDFDCFIGISYQLMNQTRAAKCDAMRRAGYTLATFFHPDVRRYNIVLGDNSFILENNTIQPFAKLGNNVFLWSGNHIGHHTTIEDDVFISSHVVIGGGATIGRGTFLGLNVTIFDHLTIGEKSLIGAGAIIGQDIPNESVVVASLNKPSSISSSMIRRF